MRINQEVTLEEQEREWSDLKVFRIGFEAYDWIVAKTEESAVEFYSKEFGRTIGEVYELTVEECDQDEDVLLWHKSKIPKEDLRLFKFEPSGRRNYYHVPFSYSIRYQDAAAPYLIDFIEEKDVTVDY